MEQGDCCFFPADAPHLFTVTGDRAKVMVIYAPPYEEDPARSKVGPG
jgi:mannose-6-phosphate isomerase-like protein (cupin superfamily)